MNDLPLPADIPGGSESLFRALIAHSWDAISLVSADGIIRFTSSAASRIHGYTAEELIGQNAFAYVHSEDQQPVLSLFATLLQQPAGSITAQFRYRHRDGSWRWIEAIGTNLLADPAVQAVVVNFRDITDRKQVEEALRESSQLNKQIIASVHEGIVVYDQEFRYVLFNSYMEELTGLSSKAVMGKRPWDLFPFLREIGMESWLPKVLTGEIVTAPDIPYKIPQSGKSGWTSGQFSPLRNALGEIVGIIGTVRDITARKKEEEQRRQFDLEMQHTQKMESLGVLAGGLAHDFNNLLTGVLGNACLALKEVPSGSALFDLIKDIETAAHRAADLTKQMLAYAGKGRVVVQAVHLSQVVEEMAALLHSVISKKAALQFDFAADLPAIEADITQIRQIVMNLIINASEALDGASGDIRLRTRMVQLDSQSEAPFLPANLPSGKYVSLEVSDTGVGMDEATKAKIFEPFFTTKVTGRGLGLSAVLGIVRGHRGGIRVSSEIGRGTTILVLLPALDRSEPQVTKESTVAIDWGEGHGTILVVDDDPISRQVARKILEEAGYQVLIAHDGEEGVEVFLQRRREIVAVLLDLMMPKKNGDEVFRELRSLTPELPIVFISGFSERSISDLFQGNIPAAFVGKPFEPATILDAVRQAIMGSKGTFLGS